MGCRVPGYSHAAYCPEGRVEELRSRLAGMEAAWRNACERGDKAAARLAEVEALLQEVYDGRQSLMSVGLVYRIGHTLNHRPADSASAEAGAGDR
jgi:hypothetical protein